MYSIETMLATYRKHKKSQAYIFGWYDKSGDVYFTIRKTMPHKTLYIDKFTGNLRMRYNANLVKSWHKTKCGCVADLYSDKYNKGYMFEKMIYNYFGKTWQYQNDAFFDGCDLEYNGIKYEIKLIAGCTICKQSTIKMLRNMDRLQA